MRRQYIYRSTMLRNFVLFWYICNLHVHYARNGRNSIIQHNMVNKCYLGDLFDNMAGGDMTRKHRYKQTRSCYYCYLIRWKGQTKNMCVSDHLTNYLLYLRRASYSFGIFYIWVNSWVIFCAIFTIISLICCFKHHPGIISSHINTQLYTKHSGLTQQS